MANPTLAHAIDPLLSRRRWLLSAGALAGAGLTMPELLRAEKSADPRRRARNCIVFFLEGGPAHQDLWDMKPEAPAEIRGEFQPISTTVPGLQVCEHLPMFARQMHHVGIVRAVHHKIVDHNAGAYQALTGRSPLNGSRLIIRDEPDNFPPYGSVVARLKGGRSKLPPFVQVPDVMSNNGYDLPGQRAGFLGAAFDPLVAGDPSAPQYEVPGLSLPSELSLDRLFRRRTLLDQVNHQRLSGERSDTAPQIEGMPEHYQRAFELLSASATRKAFNLSEEPQRVRERYGLPDRTDRSVEARKFGGLPHLGQCTLLARRLVESGVRLVTIASGRRLDQAWDTHRDHFPLLKQSLLPYADRAMSALIEDLAERGLLDETLVVFMGEFGRTPRLGQITSGAGADSAGRDHWPHCYSVLFAGGGAAGGAIYGASDKFAAYPHSNPVTPEDVAATIYHALGVSPDTQLRDNLGRPHVLSVGKPIPIFG
ncbi:MAG TPA: DUF1501 domain-containing protein [Pirellulales bacterium]|jgi:hypothetical protein|nr:DUF1501 domain-containing protein [Pirellulales bacterium]